MEDRKRQRNHGYKTLNNFAEIFFHALEVNQPPSFDSVSRFEKQTFLNRANDCEDGEEDFLKIPTCSWNQKQVLGYDTKLLLSTAVDTRRLRGR